jgi:Glycosyltransferase family 87/WD40-like Beta Propeller Repeat
MAQQTATVLSTPNSGPVAGGHSFRPGEWVVWSERVLLLLLISLFMSKGLIPGWKHLNTDFPNYYLGARLFRQGCAIERVYEWIWFQRQKDHFGVEQRLVGFIPLTLPSILPVMPLSSLPPLQAKHVWLLMNLLFLALTAVLLKSSTELKMRQVALLTFLAVLPLRDNFLYGQMHIFVLLILTLSAWLYFKDWFFLSGLLLAIAAAIKIYPALFLIFFVWKKQWRAATGLVVGLSSAALTSVSVFGWDACRLYALEVLPRALRGEVTDPYNVAWNSFTALLRRLFLNEPELNPSPVAHLPWLYAFLQPAIHGLIFVAFMWAIGSKIEDRARMKVEWATYSFLLLLLSSQPATYHFVALILTAVLVCDYLLARGQTIRAIVMVGLYALTCGPRVPLHGIAARGWSNLLLFPRLVMMVLLGAVLLGILLDLPPESISTRFNVRTALVAVSAASALVTIGFSSTVHHLKGQFSNYGMRVLTVPNSSLATDPVITSEGLFFNALVPTFPATGPNTYAVHQLRGGLDVSFAASDDWFHPTAGTIGHPRWTEVATGSGSRIVRFSSSQPNFTDDIALEVKNGEQPVASPGGEWLVYLRELKGRTSLWIRRVSATADGEATVDERQIVGPQYDVREAAFFPDHQIVFSSRHEGRFRLYEANPDSGSVNEMKAPTCSARYPAISPDGKWMAFSCERGGTWQVQVMNFETRKQIQLTNAECNAVSPIWTLDSKELIYATDCGRGLGLTALAKLNLYP